MRRSWLFNGGIDRLSATDNRDNPLVKGNTGGAPVRGRRGCFFLSGRLLNVTWLPDIHPSCWIMSVTGSKGPCVDLWSRLTSSTHLCKCAWLGHCMIMWPCCRFITLSLSTWWGFLSCVKHILSFVFLFSFFFFVLEKKNKPWQEHSDAKCSLPCISDSLQCSFFVSQVNTVKYIQWMIFNSYPLLVVQCNTLETMQ